MLFNSFGFFLFFPIVAIVAYVTGRRIIVRNICLLVASYYFYMNIKPVYALLLLAVTLLTYFCAVLLENRPRSRQKKIVLLLCIVLVFSSLFVFKYYNFVNETILSVLILLGIRWEVPNLTLLLPIGISFFTFQAAGYVIDVYRGTIKAEKNIIDYFLFVSFFPVILSGPIQRSRHLLPQIKEKHPLVYENVISGLKLMLWGYFMKLCVADRLGTYVDSIYNNMFQHNGTSFVIASLFYTIQIYADFAGYSYTAIGCAKVIGFSLPENFHRPYFSASIKEFWKRWHIALSSWFMEYLYFPLGGSRVKFLRYLLNLMIVFLVSGLWHGAAWTFVVWGGLHGLFQIIEAIIRKRRGISKRKSGFLYLLRIMCVFLLVNFAWIFFRLPTISDSIYIIKSIFTNLDMPYLAPMPMAFGLLSFLILLVKDTIDEYYPKCKLLNSDNIFISIPTSILLTEYVLLFGVLDNNQFIYFQF